MQPAWTAVLPLLQALQGRGGGCHQICVCVRHSTWVCPTKFPVANTLQTFSNWHTNLACKSVCRLAKQLMYNRKQSLACAGGRFWATCMMYSAQHRRAQQKLMLHCKEDSRAGSRAPIVQTPSCCQTSSVLTADAGKAKQHQYRMTGHQTWFA